MFCVFFVLIFPKFGIFQGDFYCSKGGMPTAAPDGMRQSGKKVYRESERELCAEFARQQLFVLSAKGVSIFLGCLRSFPLEKTSSLPCLEFILSGSGTRCSCNNTWPRCRSLDSTCFSFHRIRVGLVIFWCLRFERVWSDFRGESTATVAAAASYVGTSQAAYASATAKITTGSAKCQFSFLRCSSGANSSRDRSEGHGSADGVRDPGIATSCRSFLVVNNEWVIVKYSEHIESDLSFEMIWTVF